MNLESGLPEFRMGGIIHWHLPYITKDVFSCAGGGSFRREFPDRQE